MKSPSRTRLIRKLDTPERMASRDRLMMTAALQRLTKLHDLNAVTFASYYTHKARLLKACYFRQRFGRPYFAERND